MNNAFSWKLVKLHINLIIQNIIFPLLCYTKEDQELWETDPQEYIRMKFDVFEDYVSPVTAAQNLLHTTCKKRKDMLEKTLSFVVQVLNNPASEARMRDGALHMVGAVADVLLKKDQYKDQIEAMLVAYVFPSFESELGYLRARACWVLHYFADTRFQSDMNAFRALDLVQQCILHEKDLPVKVEAAICYQALVTSQEKVQKMAEQNVTAVALELLKVIRETENEDLAHVMQKLICMYTDELVPIAAEMTQHLALTFDQLTQSGDDENEEKSLTAMSLLNTIDTILTMMQEQKEVMLAIEPIVLTIVVKVFTKEMVDLYEEALTLVYTISSVQVSPELWRVFELMYHVFEKDGSDYFVEMMPALHNFITVDPVTFVSNQNHILAIYNMCKSILSNADVGEDAQTHAAKLLECLLLQFRGQIDQCIQPVLELVLTRLTRDLKTDELRTMCLQVVIAALWYNSDLLFEILTKLQPVGSTQPIFDHLLKTWIDDSHCFQGLHDRKMAVLGLVSLMALPPNKRPQSMSGITSHILPSILLFFEGLKVAYQAKAAADQESEDSENDETEETDDSEPEDLEDDEDHIPGARVPSSLMSQLNDHSPFPIISATMEDIDEGEDDSDADSDEEDEYEQTALESYTTPLDDDETAVDEYVLFKQTMEQLQQQEPEWFDALMSPLSPDQRKVLQEVYTLAQQRKAAAGQHSLFSPFGQPVTDSFFSLVTESRAIEKQGGYNFNSDTVPNSFSFGGKAGFA